MRKFITVAVLVALLAGSLVFKAVSDDQKEFRWYPFATRSSGKQGWLFWEMPPPYKFNNYADCQARLAQYIASDSSKTEGVKPPYGCVYHGDNFYHVYLVNWLHDGALFDGCLSKHIATPTDDSDHLPLYDPALIDEAESGPTWYCVGWWTDPALLRSQARAIELTRCQERDTDWRHVGSHELVDHLDRFNKRCAELGIKTDCKVSKQIRPPAPNETDDERFLRETEGPSAVCSG
jgi:hypothetical protein